MKPLERSLQHTVLRRLKALRATDPALAFRKRHGSAFGVQGDPDIHGVWRGVAFEIELKQPGQDPTPLQQARLKEWSAAGATVGVVHSTAELDTFLDRLRPATRR